MIDPEDRGLDHCVLCIEDQNWLIVEKVGPILAVATMFAPGIIECAVIDTSALDIDVYVEAASRLLEEAR